MGNYMIDIDDWLQSLYVGTSYWLYTNESSFVAILSL